MTAEQQTILALLANVLFDAPKIDAELTPELIREAKLQAVLPLVAQAVGSPWTCPGVPEQLARNIRVNYQHSRLHDLMTCHNIPYVILKGLASAACYPEPSLRVMGDVDFLVAEKDFSRVGEILEAEGFRPVEDTGGIHVAFHRSGSTWELHRRVNGIPSGKSGALIEEYLSDILETASLHPGLDAAVRIPDPFHHGLVLLLHTASHLTSEGVGLRHLCDWAVFLRVWDSDYFCEVFEARLKACGLWRFAQALTAVSTKYLGLPECSWASGMDDALLEGLMEDILTGGNFGRKDRDRTRQIKYIADFGAHTVDSGTDPIRQAWNNLSRKAQRQNKSRGRVLLEYTSLLLRGKRKPDTLTTWNAAAKRRDLYGSLALYQEENA